MGPLLVEVAPEGVEAPLLGSKDLAGGAGGLGLEGALHAFVATVLVGTGGFDQLGPDPEPDPVEGEVRTMTTGSSGETRISLPRSLVNRIYDHVNRHGTPLLRATGSADLHSIQAVSIGDGEYELLLGDLDLESLYSCESWECVAGELGIELEVLINTLAEQGYPWELPDLNDADEDRYVPQPEIDDILPMVAELRNGPTIGELLQGLPELIEIDSGSGGGDPESDSGNLVIFPGAGIPGPVWTDVMRSGAHGMVWYVESPMALSCLQEVLDQLDRRVSIRLA